MRTPKPIETAEARWLLPSGLPIGRQRPFTLSQPVLRRACHSRRFRFFDATLLLVCSGRLVLDDGQAILEAADAASVIVVPRGACLDIAKIPEKPEGTFRSIFLTFSQYTIVEFHRLYGVTVPDETVISAPRKVLLDSAFSDTLCYCLRGLADADASDQSQTHRLIGVLIALADRGCQFTRSTAPSIADRLRDILKSNPSHPWTAPEASRALAMSEATLRRRLAKERSRFEGLLVEVRMHHAMTLLQTTTWSVPQVARACGYSSRTRFTERFREQFGCLPSRAR